MCEEREIDPILTCASPRDGPIRAAYVARDPGQPIRTAHMTGAYVGQPIRAADVASDLVLSRTAKRITHYQGISISDEIKMKYFVIP